MQLLRLHGEKKIFFILLLGYLSTSCVPFNQLRNFPAEETTFITPDTIQRVDLTVQPEDLLRITVHGLGDPTNGDPTAPFNIDQNMQGGGGMMLQQQGNGGGSNVLELFNGYLVDTDGNIDFPILGQIFVQDKTLTEIKKDIQKRLKPYLKTDLVVVSVRYLNLKITIAGEVFSPGTIRLSNKRITLLEAIGLAGDLTPYANRTNILLVRENTDTREYIRLNLQDPMIFQSPYFYLQQNDYIYVEPNPAKVATVESQFNRVLPYISTGLGVLSLIIALSR
ncbi:MAG: polysaccharide biosynthesis/export family protein [Bacteroidota bacterium]